MLYNYVQRVCFSSLFNYCTRTCIDSAVLGWLAENVSQAVILAMECHVGFLIKTCLDGDSYRESIQTTQYASTCNVVHVHVYALHSMMYMYTRSVVRKECGNILFIVHVYTHVHVHFQCLQYSFFSFSRISVHVPYNNNVHYYFDNNFIFS